MRKSIITLVVGMLIGATALAIPYKLTRSRTVTAAQINAFFQIAVDRGAWPGVNTDVLSLCGYRTGAGGRIEVMGNRSGTDALMTTDRAASGDLVTVE